MNAIAKMTVAVASAILAIADDWKVVVACLHYSGEFHDSLSNRDHARVRELGDGYGSLRGPKTEAILDMLWDWSHVRDSSPEAVAKMAAALRGIATARLQDEVARTSDPRVVEWRRVARELAEAGNVEASRRCELEARRLEGTL